MTSGEAKVEALYNAGADEVIVSRGLDFAPEVAHAAPRGEGVDVAVEIVGSATFDADAQGDGAGRARGGGGQPGDGAWST